MSLDDELGLDAGDDLSLGTSDDLALDDADLGIDDSADLSLDAGDDLALDDATLGIDEGEDLALDGGEQQETQDLLLDEGDDLLSEDESLVIADDNPKEAFTSTVDLGQADVDVTVADKADEDLTHEEILERQIEAEDDEAYDFDDEIDDEEEYEEGTKSVKERIQGFLGSLGKKGSGDGEEGVTKILEKPTELFKSNATVSNIIEKTNTLREKLKDGTISGYVTDKVPGLASILGKKSGKNEDDETTKINPGPSYEELTEINDGDIELEVEGGKPKRGFTLNTRQLIIYGVVLAGLAYLFIAPDETPEVPEPMKLPPKKQVKKPPVKMPPPVEEPTTPPVEEPTTPPVEEPTTPPVEEPPIKEPPVIPPVENQPPVEEPPVDSTPPPVEPPPAIEDDEIDKALDDVIEKNKPQEEEPPVEPTPPPVTLEPDMGQDDPTKQQDADGTEVILPQDVIEPEASSEITKRLLKDLEVKLQKERKEQSLIGDAKPTSAPSYDKIGVGLVYNCSDSHWACVDRDTYTQCRENYAWNKQQGVEPECYPYAKLENELDCATVQQEKIDSVSDTSFCN